MAPSGSYRIAAYSAAARALDMPILVVSDSEHSMVPEVANGITVDFDQPAQALDTILATLEGQNVACVLATDDSCVELCSRLANRLNLPHNKPDAARISGARRWHGPAVIPRCFSDWRSPVSTRRN